MVPPIRADQPDWRVGEQPVEERLVAQPALLASEGRLDRGVAHRANELGASGERLLECGRPGEEGRAWPRVASTRVENGRPFHVSEPGEDEVALLGVEGEERRLASRHALVQERYEQLGEFLVGVVDEAFVDQVGISPRLFRREYRRSAAPPLRLDATFPSSEA